MNGTRWAYAVGITTALLLGVGQAVIRSQGTPAADELVPWEPYDTLGEPPYDRPVLLEFSADWCVPCLRMQVTTFRDPEFVALLDKHDLRPVRLEYVEDRKFEFTRIMWKYQASALPAMVIIATDGRATAPITGALLTKEFDRLFALRLQDSRLFWNQPGFAVSADPGRITVLSFGTWQKKPKTAKMPEPLENGSLPYLMN